MDIICDFLKWRWIDVRHLFYICDCDLIIICHSLSTRLSSCIIPNKLNAVMPYRQERPLTQETCSLDINYCPFDITRKDVFCLAFYYKWKYFVLNDHILSETICLFCFCILFSNMYPKIKFMAKNWSDLCNFYSKVIFWNFWLRKKFSSFFAEFELLMFHNNIVKLSEKLNKRNLLKICLQVTYPTDFCIICIHFY